jgi:1-deoxy-D-xylulose-5-phosphate reductoisomerase
MGPKISIDSATLANKGLEVIEAARLFGTAPDKVRVLIHPQSVVHSMIRLTDGAVYAQLSKPDMRHPIHSALHWPRFKAAPLPPLDFSSLRLDFSAPDGGRFPLLPLAYGAISRGGLYPAAYNAANESAVGAFLAERIAFLDIPRVVGYVLEMNWLEPDLALEAVLDGDRRAREAAEEMIKRL